MKSFAGERNSKISSRGFPPRLPGILLRFLVALAAFVAGANRFVFRINGEPWRSRALWGLFWASVAPAARFAVVGGRTLTPGLVLVAIGLATLAGHSRRVSRKLRVSDEVVQGFPRVTTRSLEKTIHRIETGGRCGSLRIAFLTDFHFGRPQTPDLFFEEVLSAVLEGGPDLIVIGGDLIYRGENLEGGLGFLKKLSAPLGVMAILGNHDYAEGPGQARRMLEATGIERISGREIEVVPGLMVSGHEAPWGPDLRSFETPADKGRRIFRVAVSHTPDSVYRLEAMGADLVLSGHFHGGQIRLPFLGPVFVPSVYGVRFDRGLFRVGQCGLVVSSGLGVSGPPVRVNCPPEVVFVDLA